jgi:UDP:flavonoid glycosyltransferase YjiC (YdhE family)
MAAAVRARIPQIVFPFMADQFENRKQIVKSGLGPDTCDLIKLSADGISSAITEGINNDNYKNNVREISKP